MADNPFVVKGDEWGYCVEFRTRCMNAWSDGTCMGDKIRERCEYFIKSAGKENRNESNI